MEKKNIDGEIIKYIFRTDISPYLLFIVIFIGFEGFSVYKWFAGTLAHSADSFLFPFIFLAIPLLIYGGFRLELDKNMIAYRELIFLRSKRFDLEKLTRAQIAVGFDPEQKPWELHGMYRLELYDKETYKSKPFIINIKVFSKDTLSIMAKTLIAYLPEGVQAGELEDLSKHDVSKLSAAGVNMIKKALVPTLIRMCLGAVAIKIILVIFGVK